MTGEEAYTEFLQLVNRNNTNNNINVDKARFALTYNSFRTKYLEWILDKKNEDVIRYISPLLVLDKKLVSVSAKPTHVDFSLPEDYFDHSNLQVFANGPCGRTKLKTWEVKSDNTEELYHDAFNEPSVEYEETYYFFSAKGVAISRKDFDISEVLLSYYRNPVKFDIEGYIHPDGSPSTTVNPELHDKAVRRILVGMSMEFSANNNDKGNYQLNKDRLFGAV